MSNKNIYMIQPNYLYGKSAHLPYAVGTVSAYAFQDATIKANYTLKKIQFLREDPDVCVREAQAPFLVGLSNYVWNFEYNKVLAQKFKQAYPDCFILFGGHHVTPGGALLEEYPFIDILIHGEGEEPFRQILLSFIASTSLADVPNISFRQDDGIVNTSFKEYTDCDYPSPYLEGYFDEFFTLYPDLRFELLFETNRGCPYFCSYCDWGNLKTKLRCFPLDRIFREFDWACRHNIEFFGCADANFGILPRDEDIVDRLIELKKTTGYPQKYQTSYAKSNSERIYNIGKKLDENGMNKGVTLAFQTMSPVASKNVERTNVSMQHYTDLMKRYNAADIPTYTELILGLPGETYRSFADGMNMLMEAGQHHSIYVHNCEWLPCSTMGSRRYIEKYDIGITRIPLNQPHMEFPKSSEIQEYSQIVTKTYSMDHAMWIETNLLSYVVQCFHHMNLLHCFAIFLRNEYDLPYIAFYERLLAYLDEHPDTVSGRVFADIRRRLRAVVDGTGGLLCYADEFGDVSWPFEEYAFLKIVYELDTFYEEIRAFLCGFDLPEDLFNDLLLYQQNILKRPLGKDCAFRLDYALHEYFSRVLSGASIRPEKRPNIVTIRDLDPIPDWKEYARRVVWYGRKESKNVYTDAVTVKDAQYE